MDKVSYYIGIVVGFLLVVGFGLLVRFVFKTKRVKPEYDERQMIARGKAYKVGFFTLLIYGAVCTVLQAMELHWCDGLLREVVGIVIGVGAFAIVSILNDAYLGFNENTGYTIGVMALIGFLNLGSAIIGIITDGLWKDGKVTTSIVNLLISLLFFVILMTYWLHKKQNSDVTDAEEEQ